MMVAPKINFVRPGEPGEPLISMVLIAEANPKTIQACYQAPARIGYDFSRCDVQRSTTDRVQCRLLADHNIAPKSRPENELFTFSSDQPARSTNDGENAMTFRRTIKHPREVDREAPARNDLSFRTSICIAVLMTISRQINYRWSTSRWKRKSSTAIANTTHIDIVLELLHRQRTPLY
jgi:hypothetical protein